MEVDKARKEDSPPIWLVVLGVLVSGLIALFFAYNIPKNEVCKGKLQGMDRTFFSFLLNKYVKIPSESEIHAFCFEIK